MRAQFARWMRPEQEARLRRAVMLSSRLPWQNRLAEEWRQARNIRNCEVRWRSLQMGVKTMQDEARAYPSGWVGHVPQ